jgi:hypothetical protein
MELEREAIDVSNMRNALCDASAESCLTGVGVGVCVGVGVGAIGCLGLDVETNTIEPMMRIATTPIIITSGETERFVSTFSCGTEGAGG